LSSLLRSVDVRRSGVLLRDRSSRLFDHPRASVRVSARCATAVVVAAAALWVVRALEPAVAVPVMFPAFVGIVLVAANAAGTAYGIVTMAIFGAGYAFLFIEPRRGFDLSDRHAVAVLVAYAIAGVIVASIGGALRNAYARLREEHRAVTTIHDQREDLLKALTHDVRTPLSAITMNAAMLTRSPEDADAVLRRARAIERSAARVAEMLGELIDTAHLESGHLKLERKPVDLASFAIELKGRLEGTLAVDRVSFAIPEGLPGLHVDPQRFERILVNLLSNALKYAPSPTPVVLGAAVQDREVVVSVADRGPGISQQDLPHIFEKYYRTSDAQKREGLGIGLYGTRLLVQAHGGRIWVESLVGKGTTFYVAMPSVPRSDERATAAGAPSAAPSVARDGAMLPASARTPGR
jgi:K+-sensing histidine kinase KdpD